jgi:hypothetical protein
VRRGGLWAKQMGLKRGAIGDTLGEHIENLMGTHWEFEKNMLGTKEMKKSPITTLAHPKLKRKKSRHFECMLSLPIGCMKFLSPKLFITIFGLG